MIHYFFKSLNDNEFIKSEEIRLHSWIHAFEASIEDLDKIMELTHIDFADLKDALDKYEIPRVEHEGANILIFTRHPAEQELGLYTVTLTILLTPQYLVTISPHTSGVVDQILTSSLRVTTEQTSKLLFHILLRITQEFNINIKRVRAIVLEQEKQLSDIDSVAIVNLTKSEEILNQYLTSLVPMRNLLEAISSGRFVHLYENDLDLLQDLTIAIRQSEDLCNVNIKSIQSLRDSYQIIFTNDVNKTIKRLTAIMIIFTIPMILFSFYGMNVVLPLSNNPWAFIVLLNLGIIGIIASIIIFLRKKWL